MADDKDIIIQMSKKDFEEGKEELIENTVSTSVKQSGVETDKKIESFKTELESDSKKIAEEVFKEKGEEIVGDQVAKHVNHFNIGNESSRSNEEDVEIHKTLGLVGHIAHMTKEAGGDKDLLTKQLQAVKEKDLFLEAEYIEDGLKNKSNFLNQTTGAEGGFLLNDEGLEKQVLGLLYDRTVIADKLRRTKVTVESADYPKISSGMIFEYGDENSALKTTTMKFDDIAFKMRKLGGIIPISNQMLENAANLSTLVVDNGIKAMSGQLDKDVLYGNGGQYSPVGIRKFLEVHNSGNIIATEGNTLDNIAVDVANAMYGLEGGNVSLDSAVWAMNTLDKIGLFTKKNGVGGDAFRSEMSAGTFYGNEFAYSNSIPRVANKADLFLISTDAISIVEKGGIEIKFVIDGSFKDENGVQHNGAQTEESFWRMTKKWDLMVWEKNGACIIEDVNYKG